MSNTMLTTVDNPFDPFIQFDEWKRFDESQGYFTCNLLDRIAFASDSLTDEENAHALALAKDEIVNENVLGIYKYAYKKE